jgi:LPS export ABC transporter protein LptC
VIQRRTRRGLILLALLAALSWILQKESADTANQTVDQVDTRLNYALYDFDGRLLDQNGAIHFEFQAPVLRSNDQSGVGTIESPEIRIQQEDEQWYITAESAIITSDQEHVSLMGDVYLARENQLTGDVVEITTMDVMLDVTPRTASSDSEVKITHFNDQLDATGLRLDMIANNYELLKDVRVHYETP